MKLNRYVLLGGLALIGMGLGVYKWLRMPQPDPSARRVSAARSSDQNEAAATQVDPTRGEGGTLVEEPRRPELSEAASEAPTEPQAKAGKASKRPRRKARKRPAGREAQNTDDDEDSAQAGQQSKFSGARFVPNP